MPANLGSAQFTLSADAAQLIRTLDQAEKAVKSTTSKIAQDLNVSERSVTRAVDQITKSNTAAAGSFVDFAKSTVGLTAAFVGVSLGAEGVKQALDAVATATLKADQAQRTLNATYSTAGPIFQKFADEQAKAFNRTNTEVETGVARLAVLQNQYGITGEEIQKLTRIALNLGATFGDTAEAFRSVEAAIRGEPEALEKYGIALQQNAIQNSDLLTESQKKNFASLDAVTQARLRYQIILQRSSQFEGAAGKRAESTQGNIDKLARSTDELEKALGKGLNPTLNQTSGLLADVTQGAADAVNAFAKYQEIGAKARPNNQLAMDIAQAGLLQGILNNIVANAAFGAGLSIGGGAPAQTPEAGPILGPSPGEVTSARDRAAAAEKERQDAIADVRKQARADEAKAGEEAAQAEHDRAIKALDDQKVIYEVERDAKLKAVDAATKAALDGIEQEARAAAADSDAKIAHLHVEEEAAKRTAAARHDDVVAGLEAEQKATEDATAENIRQLEIQRDAAKQASEDTRDAAIAALDAEKRARDQARTEEDRALEDSATHAKRLEDDRHQGVLRGLDDETKAANDSKDAQLRNLEEIGKKAEDRHAQRLRDLSDEADADRERHDAAVKALDDEGQAAERAHDAGVKAIEDQGKAAQDEHDKVLRRLSDEGDAAKAAHDATVRAGEDEQRAAGVVHEQRLAQIEAEGQAASNEHERVTRAIADQGKAASDAHERVQREISDEGDAAKSVHDQRVRLLDDLGRAAHDQHDKIVRDIQDEGDEAQRVHDAELRALSERADAEDEHHRLILSNLDAEQKARQDAVDEQLKALDDLDRAAQQAARQQQLAGAVEGAKRDVQRAQSTGNLSEIEAANRKLAEAQQAVLDDQTKNQRDATRAQLQNQKDAIKEEIDARKDAEDERAQILKDELAAEKQAADDRLKLVKDGLDARKQAADDELALTQDTLDARKREADDELALVQKGLAARKQAADDEYALIQDGLAARKQAEDDAYALIQDNLKAQKDAADAAYKLVQDDVAARKLAADDALKAVQDRLAKEKTAEDDAFKQGQDRRAAEKTALDEQYRAGQESRAAVKAQLDQQLKDALKRIDDEKTAEDDAFNKTKDRLDKRKTAIGDANKDELDKIAARKLAENDAHDNAVTKAQDQATQEKRAIADRRTAEDLADQARRKQIQDAFDNEARDRRARYDDEATGEIPALRRALAAAQEHFRQRKDAADKAYQSETQQIDDTYNNAETGLIPLAQKAAAAIATKYRDMATDVNASAQAQKAAINDVYTNPGKTGLIDKLEQARDETEKKLQKQREYWQAWAEDIGGPQGKIKSVMDRFDALIGKIKEAGGEVKVTTQPGQPGTPQDRRPEQGGDDPGGNAAYAPVVRHAGPGTAWTSAGTHGGHPAVDIMAPIGEPIYAPIGGRSHAQTFPLGGNTSQLLGDDGRGYYFAHGSVPFKDGRVEKGEQIGQVGDTGNARGGPPHVHFAISSHGTGLFGELNGSGDVLGDASWWTTGAPALTGQPTQPGGRTFEFDLFGRHFVFTLPGGSGVGPHGNNSAEFVRLLAAAAGTAAEFDLPAAIMAAIPINEGLRSQLQTQYHNLFSIKGTGPAGSVTLPTDEIIDGQRVTVNDQFRVYHNEAESFHDFGELVAKSGIYRDAVESYHRDHDVPKFMHLLGRKYATDPNFADQVLKIAGYANGGPILGPTLLVNKHGPYAMAGEVPGRPEWVTPGSAGNITIDLRGAQSFDGHRFEDLLVRSLTRADLRGRLTFLGGS